MTALEDAYSFKLYQQPNLLELARELIEMLPQQRHKIVLTLRFVEDLTEEEVSLQLGVSRQRVNQLVRAGIKQIQQQLKEQR